MNRVGNMKCGEKWLENFQSESFSIRTYKGRAPASEHMLLRGGLPSEIVLQGGSLESKIYSVRLLNQAGSGPVSKKFAGFLPDISSKKCISKILKCIVFVQF